MYTFIPGMMVDIWSDTGAHLGYGKVVAVKGISLVIRYKHDRHGLVKIMVNSANCSPRA